MRSGKVVCISGTSSVGKSSTSSLLKEKLGDSWLHFKVDSYLQMFGAKYNNIFNNNNAYQEANYDLISQKNEIYYVEKNADYGFDVKYGEVSVLLYNTIPSSIKVLADSGFNVIVDAFVENENHIELMNNLMPNYKMHFVYLYADNTALLYREKDRKNRLKGTAVNWLKSFNPSIYDLQINTTHLSPNDVSDKIISILD